jgi:hypothetical protein
MPGEFGESLVDVLALECVVPKATLRDRTTSAGPARKVSDLPATSPDASPAESYFPNTNEEKDFNMLLLNLPTTAGREGTCRINGKQADFRLFRNRIELRCGATGTWERRAILSRRTLGGITLYVCDGGPAGEDFTVQADPPANSEATQESGATSPFRFRACCPEAGCETYHQTLHWLQSLGLEPSCSFCDFLYVSG